MKLAVGDYLERDMWSDGNVTSDCGIYKSTQKIWQYSKLVQLLHSMRNFQMNDGPNLAHKVTLPTLTAQMSISNEWQQVWISLTQYDVVDIEQLCQSHTRPIIH